jgi:transposase
VWTSEKRPRYDRSKLRYPSDLTDGEWSLIGPLIPSAKKGGNKRTVDVRAVANGWCISSAPAVSERRCRRICRRSTANDYLRRWDHDRTLDRIHHAL